MINRKELKERALSSLNGKWGTPITAMFMMLVISLVSAVAALVPILGVIIVALVSSTLTMGMTSLFMKVASGEDAKYDEVLSQGKNAIGALLVMFLTGLFTALWTLLLVIPGIIAGFSYTMAPYIFIENPNMGATDILRRSKEMMRGYKFEYFLLQLSFFGWVILCAFTFGIGYLWLFPFMGVTNANFYYKVKENQK